MSWFVARTYFDTIRPVYRASRLLLVHFTTIDFSARIVHRSLTDLVCFVLAALLDVYSASCGLRAILAFLSLTDSVLVNVGTYGATVLCCLFAVTVPWWNNYNGFVIFELYNNIARCSDELLVLGLTVNHRRKFILATVYVTYFVSLPFQVLLTYSYAPSLFKWVGMDRLYTDFRSTFAFARMLLILCLCNCYSSLTLLSLRTHFKLLNEAICKYFPTSVQTQASHVGDVPSTQRLIQTLAKLHERLSNTVHLFNHCFSMQYAVLMWAGYAFTIFSAFFLIHSYTTNVTAEMRWLSRTNMVLDGLFVFYIVEFMALASVVNSECSRTVVVIHKVIAYGRFEKRVLKELRTFSQQLSHHSPRITCHLYDFNWELFYRMAGTLTTYLVILIQFDLKNINYETL
ncbi:putative gustatory receptor 22a [Culex pipiens pallens]|uniref:putative gustatory receptor 22a n=1 Tax=Culex pipiens pallens TaxID=42434 RepID=UPI00195393C7|nr:putative gustatory receptor 22a [Culex pipiens pallens]